MLNGGIYYVLLSGFNILMIVNKVKTVIRVAFYCLASYFWCLIAAHLFSGIVKDEKSIFLISVLIWLLFMAYSVKWHKDQGKKLDW